MSRVFLAWELGSNLGHLARLLPVARRLKTQGHEVLVAVRDVGLATEVLSADGIRFVQAPRISGASQDAPRPRSFAEILLAQGWASPTVLWGLVQAWGNLLRLFAPSVVVLDYAPTALLATRILGLPRCALGTGFELPPCTDPLPGFPGIEAVSAEDLMAAEGRVLEAVNQVLGAYRAPRLGALRDLFESCCRWLTTVLDLDHYGPRDHETYVGPIGALERGERLSWPEGFAHRILAYLRPGTPALMEILRALAALEDVAVICAVPGLSPDWGASLAARPGFHLLPRPVHLPTLLPRASALVSYGPAGSVAEAVLQGVPQLISPAHVEAQITAWRVECLGAGLMLRGDENEAAIGTALRRVASDPTLRRGANALAVRYRQLDAEAAVERIVTDIERLASQGCDSAPRVAG